MQLALSAVPRPSRTHIEIDRDGFRRTFWLWPDGSWVVACERNGEPPRFAGSPSRAMHVSVGDGVLTLVIADTSRMTTVPAPASAAMRVTSVPVDSVPVFPSEAMTARDDGDGDRPARARLAR